MFTDSYLIHIYKKRILKVYSRVLEDSKNLNLSNDVINIIYNYHYINIIQYWIFNIYKFFKNIFRIL